VRVNLVSTSRVIDVNGVPARVWQGRTESGIEVTALITRISVERTEDTTEFEAELQECVQASTHVDAWPDRLVL
jgi:hypothetical protein